MCCSCLGDDLTIRVSEVAGNSESINLTGKQINVIRRFSPLFSLGIESGRASEMGGKRSKLYAIPDPLKFHCLSIQIWFWYERECLCFLYEMLTVAPTQSEIILLNHVALESENHTSCYFCRMRNDVLYLFTYRPTYIFKN